MKIFRHFNKTENQVRPVLVIGNFDGVHLGHQALILEGKRLAEKHKVPLAVMTFEPHPKTFFNPEKKSHLLTSWRIKSMIMAGLGVDCLYIAEFNHEFSNLQPEEFVLSSVVNSINASFVVVGEDFAFGKGGKGKVDTLQNLAEKYDFGVLVVSAVKDETGKKHSSTSVRKALAEGRPDLAAQILGRYWEVEGKVEHGFHRGNKLGFPTANISFGEFVRPKYGIYAVLAVIEDDKNSKSIKGVANIGGSPTFALDNELIEVHLLDFSGDIYHKHLRVSLIEYLREPIKFDSIDALINQISLDVEQARAILTKIEKKQVGT